jgi:hypothetical protein
MKYIDIDKKNDLPGKIITETDTFAFRCYPGIGCFNRCCRNLNLFLYPYDVLRLKQSLEMSSDEFLERHVDAVLCPGNFFPEVLLRMSENQEKTCPFLTDSGCSVYADRPDTCRSFPIEQGVQYDAARKKDTPIYFYRPPDFCLGQHEEQRWNIAGWVTDQEAQLYHRMTIHWAQLKRLFQNDPWGAEGPEGSRAKMTFMATYNLDRFRDFVFNSSFLKRYKVRSAIQETLKADDLELLEFGMDWVRLFLWGIPSKKIRLR